jgi:hypothetical protein
MGYSSKNNPAQILIAKLFKNTNALSRNAKSYVLYYRCIRYFDASFSGALCKTAGLVNLSIKIIIRLLPIKSDGVVNTNRFIFYYFQKWDKGVVF